MTPFLARLVVGVLALYGGTLGLLALLFLGFGDLRLALVTGLAAVACGIVAGYVWGGRNDA